MHQNNEREESELEGDETMEDGDYDEEESDLDYDPCYAPEARWMM